MIEQSLQCGKATCIAFNRRGTLLAAGTSRGSVVIWDFETRSVAREFRDGLPGDDNDPIVVLSVSWSRDGKKIISAGSDATVSLWDVEAEDDQDALVNKYAFQASLHQVQFCPTNASLALVSQVEAGPVTLALNRGKKKTPLPQFAGIVDLPSYVCRMPSAGLALEENSTAAYAIYSKTGRYIFVANNRGMITVVETATMDIVQALRVPEGATIIKRLEMSHDGKHLLVVSMTKSIASYDINDVDLSPESRDYEVLVPAATLRNPVHNSQWAAAGFSHDGEYVVGARAGGHHELHVWSRSMGVFERVLEGDKEAKGITQILPHPVRPLVVAVGANGQLYVWAKSYTENWSAFAPDFHELEENEEYVEREDEFDAVKRDDDDPGGVTAKMLGAPEVVAKGAATEAAMMVMETEAAVRAEFEAAEAAEVAAAAAEAAAAAAAAAEEARQIAVPDLAAAAGALPDTTPGTMTVPDTATGATSASTAARVGEDTLEDTMVAYEPKAEGGEAAMASVKEDLEEAKEAAAIVAVSDAVPESAQAPPLPSVENPEGGGGGDPVSGVVLPAPAALENPAPAAAEKPKKVVDMGRGITVMSPEDVLALSAKLRGQRSEAAAAAAAVAEASSLAKAAAAATDAAAKKEAAAAEATAATAKAAQDAQVEFVDVLTLDTGYFSDADDENCLHYLPRRLKPDPEATRIVQQRLERWKSRERRLSTGGTPTGKKQKVGEDGGDGVNDVEEDEEDEDDEEDDEEDEEEGDEEEGDEEEGDEEEGDEEDEEDEEDDEDDDDDDDDEDDDDEEEDDDDEEEEEEDDGEEEDADEEGGEFPNDGEGMDIDGDDSAP